MQWNLMDVGIMDVHDVIPMIENATMICRNAQEKESTARIGIHCS